MEVPAYKVPVVVDTTGAGDAFLGGIIVGMFVLLFDCAATHVSAVVRYSEDRGTRDC